MSLFASSPANRKFLLVVIAVAVILRVGTIALFHPPLISDDKDYDAIARSLAHGDGFKLDGNSTAYRLPGYPLLLAATYAVFGDSKVPIRIIQVIADAISCLLLFNIGKKMFSEKAGLLAAAILALFPIQVLYVSHVMTETIFTTILLLIVWVVVEESDVHGPAQFIILGALTGLGMLMRTTVALVPLVIFLYRWKNGVSLKTNVRSLAIVAITALIIVSPWLIRNYVEFHRVSFTSNAGVNFWMGNHSGASGAYSFPKENNPLITVADDFDRSDLGFKLGIEFVRTHPLESVIIEGKKIAHFFAADYWLLMTMEYKPEWASAQNAAAVFARLSIVDILILHLPYAAVLLLGTFGLTCLGKQRRKKFLFSSCTSSVLARRPLGLLCRCSLPFSDCADIYSCCRIRLVYFSRQDFSTNENAIAHLHPHLSPLCRRLARRDYYASVKSNNPPTCCGTSFFKKRARFWFPGIGLSISSPKNTLTL